MGEIRRNKSVRKKGRRRDKGNNRGLRGDEKYEKKRVWRKYEKMKI